MSGIHWESPLSGHHQARHQGHEVLIQTIRHPRDPKRSMYEIKMDGVAIDSKYTLKDAKTFAAKAIYGKKSNVVRKVTELPSQMPDKETIIEGLIAAGYRIKDHEAEKLAQSKTAYVETPKGGSDRLTPLKVARIVHKHVKPVSKPVAPTIQPEPTHTQNVLPVAAPLDDFDIFDHITDNHAHVAPLPEPVPATLPQVTLAPIQENPKAVDFVIRGQLAFDGDNPLAVMQELQAVMDMLRATAKDPQAITCSAVMPSLLNL